MRRWSIHLLCGLSLLIFLLAMGIWVRSYFVADGIGRQCNRLEGRGREAIFKGVYYQLSWSCGSVHFRRTQHDSGFGFDDVEGWNYKSFPPLRNISEPRSSGDRMNIHFGQFQLYHAAGGDSFGPLSYRSVILPLWLFGLFAIPPLLWLRRWRRKRGRGFPVMVAEPAEATP